MAEQSSDANAWDQIEGARRTGTVELDPGILGLTALPEFISQLKQLLVIGLSDNGLMEGKK